MFYSVLYLKRDAVCSVVAFKGRFSSTLILPTSNLDVALSKLCENCAKFSNCGCVNFVCSKLNIARKSRSDSVKFETSTGI